jgi:hypothetical protein
VVCWGENHDGQLGASLPTYGWFTPGGGGCGGDLFERPSEWSDTPVAVAW